MIDVPKEELGGGVAPGRSCGDSAPVIPTALLAATVTLGAPAPIPMVGHVVIEPTAPAAIVAEVPGTSWIAPSGLAPGVGIVPGTAVGDMVAVVGDAATVAGDVVAVNGDVVGVTGDVMPVAGALRGEVDLTCAKAELQPTKIMAAVMRTKLRIEASCRLTHQNR